MVAGTHIPPQLGERDGQEKKDGSATEVENSSLQLQTAPQYQVDLDASKILSHTKDRNILLASEYRNEDCLHIENEENLDNLSKILRLNSGIELQDGNWKCALCNLVLSCVNEYKIHLHQYHANPNMLTLYHIKEFSISNHLVIQPQDGDQDELLYRCHECFNVMGTSTCLRDHLKSHVKMSDTVSKILPIAQRSKQHSIKRLRKVSLSDNQSGQDNQTKKSPHRPQRLAALQRRLVSVESDLSDEFNSNSENESDLSNRMARPQRECKSRTKTLVAISLAEQDYDKFDLDFGKFKTDIVNKVSESGLPESNNNGQVLKESNKPKFFFSEIFSSDLKVEEDSALKVETIKLVSKAKDSKKPREPKCSRKKNSQKFTNYHPTNSKAKSPGFPLKDRKKVSKLVSEVVIESGDYICLSCSTPFSDYPLLVAHKKKCSEEKYLLAAEKLLKKPRIKKENVGFTDELSQYVTESVVKVPETTFNNMHGKLNHIKTEDAQKYADNCPNALGLVRMNYSGDWSVKDVWETANWMPKDGQLSWQSYEVVAAINSHLDSHQQINLSPPINSRSIENTESAMKTPIKNNEGDFEGFGTRIGSKKSIKSNISPLNANLLTSKLTSQISDRQRPVITNPQMQRNFLIKLSTIPWAEQRRVKNSFDATLTPKRVKKTERQLDLLSRQQPVIPIKLDLKQVGKSVKYSRNRSRIIEKELKERLDVKSEGLVVENKIAGEWEIEHTFVCSVCGVEYDDVVEIMHHKWEAHPHCIVSHVSLKHDLQKPPDLLYPQVGPSKVTKNDESLHPASFSCSKCQQLFQLATHFHSHILGCGVSEDEMPTRRKRKRGHGGGLKSTVRMMKKSGLSNEASPQKRKKALSRNFSNIPLVPTHTRSTRFKEIKEKEAKILKAEQVKEKIRKSKKGLRGRKKKEETSFDKEVKRVVRNILDKVDEGINLRSEKGILKQRLASKEKTTSRSATLSTNLSPRGRRSARLIGSAMETTKTESKDLTNVASKEKSDFPVVPYVVLDAIEFILDNVLLHRNVSPKKSVKVTAFNDDVGPRISNIERLSRTIVKRSRSNSKEPPSEVDSLMSKNFDSSKHFYSLSTPVKEDSPASRLQSDLSDKLEQKENHAKRRAISRPTSPVHKMRRNSFSLHLKVSVLDRIVAGETMSAVSTDLDIPVNVIAKWWLIREELKRKFEHESVNDNLSHLIADSENELFTNKMEKVVEKKTNEVLLKFIDNENRGFKKARNTKLETKDSTLSEEKSLIQSKHKFKSRRRIGPKLSSKMKKLKRKKTLKLLKNDLESENIKLGAGIPLTSRPRRQSSILNTSMPPSSSFRQFMPLEVKQEVIQRIKKGESQVTVARDLDLSVSTVSSWWRKKKALMGNDGVIQTNDYIEDHTIEELVRMEGIQDAESSQVNRVSATFDNLLFHQVRDTEIVDEIPGPVPRIILEITNPVKDGNEMNTLVQAKNLDIEVSNPKTLDGQQQTNAKAEVINLVQGDKNSLKSELDILSLNQDVPSDKKDANEDILTEKLSDVSVNISNSDQKCLDLFTKIDIADDCTEIDVKAPVKTELLQSMKLAFNALSLNTVHKINLISNTASLEPKDFDDQHSLSPKTESFTNKTNELHSPSANSNASSSFSATCKGKATLSGELRLQDYPKKRKSLEFLANTLMQKALAHTAISLDCEKDIPCGILKSEIKSNKNKQMSSGEES